MFVSPEAPCETAPSAEVSPWARRYAAEAPVFGSSFACSEANAARASRSRADATSTLGLALRVRSIKSLRIGSFNCVHQRVLGVSLLTCDGARTKPDLGPSPTEGGPW